MDSTLTLMIIVPVIILSSVTASIPSLKFIGIGYNLLKGNPDGGSSRRGGVDPGLLVARKVFQISPGDKPREVIYHKRYSCVDARTNYIFYGTKSYQEKLNTGIDSSGKGTKSLVGFEFSLSSRYKQIKTQTLKRRRVFLDEVETCNLGKIRFAEELARSDGFSVSRNFANAVCNLPSHYDTRKYVQFLDDWGTHVTMAVEFGHRTIKRNQSSLTEFIEDVEKTRKYKSKAGVTLKEFGGSVGSDFETSKHTNLSLYNLGQYQYTLTSGSPDHPEPVHLTLKTLVTALEPKYWNSDEVLSVCPDVSSQLAVKTDNLLKALNEYARFKMIPKSMDPELKIPIIWPRGTYGLIKTTSGCPAGRVYWSEGWRYQDTENTNNKNSWSDPLHLSGNFSRNIRLDFCLKGNPQYSEFDVEWPSGDYCILKYGTCPSGFEYGWVRWDDEDQRNKNSYHGTLPDGRYDKNTRIDFCCRNDSLPGREILLPTEKPFILLKYTGIRACQRVYGMTSHEEFVYWDNDDTINKDRVGGAHPYEDGGKRNHRLHFCYYTKKT